MSNLAAHGALATPQPTNLTSPAAVTTTSTTVRNNVSVTNINCGMVDGTPMATNGNIVPIGGGFYNGGSGAGSGAMGSTGAIRIPITKTDEDSDSEAELTNIENLKVRRRVSASVMGPTDGATGNCSYSKNGPRPMSWEGELSETETTETELMETENSLSNSATALMSIPSQPQSQPSSIGVAVIRSEATTTTTITKNTTSTPAATRPSSATPSRLKSEMDILPVDLLNSSAQGGLYSPLTKLKLAPTQSDPINLKFDPDTASSIIAAGGASAAAGASPLLTRNRSTTLPLPANPSPDSAIHSVYTHSSPSQSPLTSRHAPYTPSLSRNNSDASHSSCYSYSSEFSPTHSPIQGRHAQPAPAVMYGNFNGSLHHSILYRPVSVDGAGFVAIAPKIETAQNLSTDPTQTPPTTTPSLGLADSLASSQGGISRQQLINSPCPICGDKISGFHYGIFSCESCKGFFKRTVQNRKNYVCVRGGPCPVMISTRKKCPACRFEKCLQKGMKLEAIREDRTRGGRSTYQCSYTLPNSMLSPLLSPDQQNAAALATAAGQQQQQHHQHQQQQQQRLGQTGLSPHGSFNGYNGTHPCKAEPSDPQNLCSSTPLKNGTSERSSSVPTLLQEIMDVEHLWLYNEAELTRLNQPLSSGSAGTGQNEGTTSSHQMTNPILASAGLSSNGENANPDLIAHLCNVADHRLFKIVKWCKSLPLFKNISIEDQICLLINSWCELLLFSCCFRSVDTPGEIKLSQGKKITLAQAKSSGLQACIERMLNLADHLRRLRVDRYEYVAMKVIVLLQSDTSELEEPVKVRECQEKALQSLQAYTLAHYPDMPSKFGELLLRIPELQRTCQLGKEMLTLKSRDGNGDFNLLMELLRGEH